MKRKDTSVILEGLHRQVQTKIVELDEYLIETGLLPYGVVVTAGLDGKHSVRSRHYIGTAFDMRTWTTATSGIQITGAKRLALFRAVKAYLGPNWFILDEGNHFHIDYRPLYEI